MWEFTINGKVFKFKTLKEARYMAQWNEGITIISKTNAKTKPLKFNRGTVCQSN
jgi:hypothetical protein